MQGMQRPDMGPRRRAAQRRARRREIARRRRRLAIPAALAIVIAGVAAIVAGSEGSGGPVRSGPNAQRPATRRGQRQAAGLHGGRHPNGPHEAKEGIPAGVALAARSVSAPVLMYHVINPPPPGAPFPGLYVPASEFAEQMQTLARAGFHAVTQDRLWRHWRQGAPLPAKPIVITFDNGYQSQDTNALPVLQRLGWKAVENIQLTGLPPSQGGLSHTQVEKLIAAGWELDTQGFSHADLIALDASQLRYQVEVARRTIQRRYGVPVRWFCYPSGHYDATVIAAVKQAGYLGSTTVVPGWASPDEDPYRLPRLRVLGGTSGAALLELIAGTEHAPPPPTSYE